MVLFSRKWKGTEAQGLPQVYLRVKPEHNMKGRMWGHERTKGLIR